MKRLDALKSMIEEKRLGFKMTETMTGEHEFVGDAGMEGRHFFEFNVDWGPRELGKWINPFNEEFLVQPLEGTVTVGGLCTDAPCSGTLELRYFKDAKIRYSFEFEAQGTRYRYLGEKVNIKPWNLPVSHTTCFGTLVEADSGKLISRSVTHFRLRTAPAFVASIHLA